MGWKLGAFPSQTIGFLKKELIILVENLIRLNVGVTQGSELGPALSDGRTGLDREVAKFTGGKRDSV